MDFMKDKPFALQSLQGDMDQPAECGRLSNRLPVKQRQYFCASIVHKMDGTVTALQAKPFRGKSNTLFPSPADTTAANPRDNLSLRKLA